MDTCFRRDLFVGLVSIKSWLKCWKPAWNLRNDRKTPNYWRVLLYFIECVRNYTLFHHQKDGVLLIYERSLLLHNTPAPIDYKVIFKGSPADLWGKVRNRDRDASTEQRVRNVPLASADVRGGRRLLD